MKIRAKGILACLSAASLLAVAACGSGTSENGEAKPITSLRIMVPNAPGGGYDTTARVAAKIMEDNNIVKDLEVFNLEGAGGTVGLSRTVQSKGKETELMMMGLGVVGAVYTNKSQSTLADTTPIARLISEPDILVVPAKSKFKTLDDVITAWKANPEKTPVGGGSSPGGPDHLAPHLLAKAIGLEPKKVNFVTYDGGGPLLAALLNGEVKFGFSGVSEYKDQIEAGQLRVLAVTSPKRVPGFDAPTLQEQGVDLDFTNWRGLVAPPGISDAQRDAVIATLTKLHDTQDWKDAEKENGWTDAFITGDEYGDFLTSESARVKDILSQLGLVS